MVFGRYIFVKTCIVGSTGRFSRTSSGGLYTRIIIYRRVSRVWPRHITYYSRPIRIEVYY